MPGRVYGCFFDDDTGIANRDAIGITQMVFEVDYPHQDTTWPNTHKVVERIAAQVTPEELERILRGNAIDMLGLPPPWFRWWTTHGVRRSRSRGKDPPLAVHRRPGRRQLGEVVGVVVVASLVRAFQFGKDAASR